MKKAFLVLAGLVVAAASADACPFGRLRDRLADRRDTTTTTVQQTTTRTVRTTATSSMTVAPTAAQVKALLVGAAVGWSGTLQFDNGKLVRVDDLYRFENTPNK